MFNRNCKFEITDDEQNAIEKWYSDICKKRGSNYFGAIGGDISIEFTLTSIGMVIVAKCGNKELVVRELGT